MKLLSVAIALSLSGLAQAQGLEDIEGESGKKASKANSKKRAKAIESEVVREVERGYYLKSNIGSTMMLQTHGGGLLKPGTALALTFGSDFLDRERTSMAWELEFGQSLHNGLKFDEQVPAGIPANALIQGDIHLFSGAAVIEASYYLSRRVGLGMRAGGGVILTPLLIFPSTYQTTVVQEQWNGTNPGVHDSPHPVGLGGPTFEYYTKLSHFSVGADASAWYAVGFDFGLNYSGYLKYTF